MILQFILLQIKDLEPSSLRSSENLFENVQGRPCHKNVSLFFKLLKFEVIYKNYYYGVLSYNEIRRYFSFLKYTQTRLQFELVWIEPLSSVRK